MRRIDIYNLTYQAMKPFYFQVNFDKKGVEFKDDGTVSIRGMASTADVDRYGDIVEPKAFENTLETFAKNPIMLLQHDAEKAIGRFSETTVTKKGLEVQGDVLYNTDDCITKIKDGVLGAFSIGYYPKKYEIRNGEGVLLATENGYEPGATWEDVWNDNTVIRTIKELDLIEISVVSTPANPNAVFSLEKSVKSFFDETKTEWKKLLEKKEETPETPEDTPTDNEDAPAEETTETPPTTPEGEHSEVDEPNDADNVVNDVLNQEEGAGETPATPEAPADETDGSSETPTETKETSRDEKELKELHSDIKTLSDAVASYKAVVVSMVEALDDQNRELKELRSLVAAIPLKKGLVMNGREESKEVGYITSLIQNAQ